jgi:hypothetical protein
MVRRRTRISDARHRPTPAESLHLSGRCSWAKRVNAIEVASPAAIRRNVLLDGGRFFREEMIFANPANLIDSRLRMMPMLLMQNAETISRLVNQGEFILKTYHAEYEKDPVGHKTDFLRGNLVGWRETLHTLYHDDAEEIVDRVVAETRLDIPDSRSRSSWFTHPCHQNSREQNDEVIAA